MAGQGVGEAGATRLVSHPVLRAYTCVSHICDKCHNLSYKITDNK
jgi:hypothetical protein